MNNDKIRRFTAYCLDLLIITLIASGLFEIKALHPNADKYETAYNEYHDYITKVNEAGKKDETKEEGIIIGYISDKLAEEDLDNLETELIRIDGVSSADLVKDEDLADLNIESDIKEDLVLKNILNYLNDNKGLKSYIITIEDSKKAEDIIKEIKKIENITDVQEYIDSDAKAEEVKALTDMSDEEKKEYFEKTGSMLRDVDYYGISYNVCWLAVVVLYFTLFPYFNKGMTIGKRVVKLRVVRSDDENKKVGLWQYFLKAILCPIYGTGILSNALTFIVMIVTPLFLDGAKFASTLSYINLAICVLCYIDVFMIAFKKDSLGYSDKLAKVKVTDYVRD